jgi:glycine cleavage system H protein
MKYTKTHEWVSIERNIATVGITDYAQKEIGEIVFIELPKRNIQVKAGEDIVVLESTKAAIDLYSPLSGKIIEVNDSLKDNPEKINTSPQNEGWIYKILLENVEEISSLLNENEYFNLIRSAS